MNNIFPSFLLTTFFILSATTYSSACPCSNPCGGGNEPCIPEYNGGECTEDLQLQETFYGDKTDRLYEKLYEHTRSESIVLNFNLNSTNCNKNVTTDESRYTSTNYTIEAATLDLVFSSSDSDSETISIFTGIDDGNGTLVDNFQYDLGYWKRTNYFGSGKYVTQSAKRTIDLTEYLSYIQDGLFDIVIRAGGKNGIQDDITLETASLYVTAVCNNSPAPVPEPATMALLGVGLIGLAGFCRRAQNINNKTNFK